jgi:hypothetical protein
MKKRELKEVIKKPGNPYIIFYKERFSILRNQM